MKTKKECPKCSGAVSYARKFDAFFCPACLIWIEDACSDLSCEFCKERPPVPQKDFGNE